ncbi:hypothetical protein M441DRAFT_454287 [Trichoderma asperellum CBS 433.97]|uniref:Uncharacterized protein n=1 Tax=Trichoderma asperellum (strain ATCC 204424 / CBS 433.97 / NBRC 101777) TaxID=1042311 RepID=A0A2T3ZIP4_TRIA4|nr:hypothetical protein M441DRAFT_454287 [Trichoderma asperellum CBS 433.97]PTB44677.1 hypothetical protein M441DRAFT_454287 [Trichoderma asperellum CBS 433.97]
MRWSRCRDELFIWQLLRTWHLYRYDVKWVLPVAVHVLHVEHSFNSFHHKDAEEAGRGGIHMCRPIAILMRSSTNVAPRRSTPDRAYTHLRCPMST